MAIPTGVAINAGMGLLTPGGGYEGYKAVLEDPDDPSKTSNVLGEIAMKYIIGRTGGLLLTRSSRRSVPTSPVLSTTSTKPSNTTRLRTTTPRMETRQWVLEHCGSLRKGSTVLSFRCSTLTACNHRLNLMPHPSLEVLLSKERVRYEYTDKYGGSAVRPKNGEASWVVWEV